MLGYVGLFRLDDVEYDLACTFPDNTAVLVNAGEGDTERGVIV